MSYSNMYLEGFMKTILIILSILFSIALSAQTIPNLPIPLGAGTAEVWNNEIYYFGGSNNWSGSICYPRIYKYNGTFWAYHDSIPMWNVDSVLIVNDLYLISGWPSGSSYSLKYNMILQNWEYLPSRPNTATWVVTAEYFNNKIYLFNYLGYVFEYSINDSLWLTKTSCSASGTKDISSIKYMNEIYIIGFNSATFFKYSPASDQWSQLANSPYQVGACAMGIINDKIYCVGGNLNGSSAADYKSTIVYNITTNTWAVDSLQLSGKRHWMATAEYAGGLYVLGGIDSTANSVNIVEEIVPQGTSGVFGNREIPKQYSLSSNYPNPFNPSTNITYSIPKTEFVTIKIFNILGQEITTLLNKELSAGIYDMNWDATPFSGGVSFLQFQAGTYLQIRKLIYLK